MIDPMFLSCYICWERIPYRRGPSCRASDRTSSRAPGRGHFLPETVGIGLGHEWRTFITCALATPQKCSILADLWERAAKGSGRILMEVLCSFKDLGAVVAGADRWYRRNGCFTKCHRGGRWGSYIQGSDCAQTAGRKGFCICVTIKEGFAKSSKTRTGGLGRKKQNKTG